MKQAGRSREAKGMDLLVHPERREAALWRSFLECRTSGSRQLLFDHYRPFAAQLARTEFRRRRRANFELGDLEQLAFEALLQAIDRFDPSRGAPFESFVRLRIKGQISNGLAKMSESGAQASYRRRAERDRLRSLSTDPAQNDVADDPLQALSRLAATLVLGIMLDEGAPQDPDAIADSVPSAYESLALREMQHCLWQQVDTLPEREAFVLRQHYAKDVSFKVIAELLGISKGRVSQIHRQALLRLRSQLAKFR